MSREIIEAVRVIEKEKGIDGDTLINALEDALLAAYKKTPGATRHATVELDNEGDFRVYSIDLPSDIEERLIEEARERITRMLGQVPYWSALTRFLPPEWGAGPRRRWCHRCAAPCCAVSSVECIADGMGARRLARRLWRPPEENPGILPDLGAFGVETSRLFTRHALGSHRV
jgi:hypothetical protein